MGFNAQRPAVARLLNDAPLQRAFAALHRCGPRPNAFFLVTGKNARAGQDAGDAKPLGNCGRPISKICGLKNKAECAIHGMGQIGTGTGPGDDAAAKVAAWRAKLAMPARMTVPCMALPTDIAPTAAGRRTQIAELRKKHGLAVKQRLDVMVAEAKFRCFRM